MMLIHHPPDLLCCSGRAEQEPLHLLTLKLSKQVTLLFSLDTLVQDSYGATV